MKSYKQRCGLAKALDVVGDRWTLLIVRELLIRDGCRYTDLQNGLPGIATNLLAERLRELEAAGVVTREEMPPPIATTLFKLTPRGKALERAISELGLWGAPLLADSAKDDVMQGHWLVLPLRLYLADSSPGEPDIAVELHTGSETITIASSHGAVDVRLGAADKASAVVKGKPEILLQLLTGRIDLARAEARGVRWTGSLQALQRLVPAKTRDMEVRDQPLPS
jgi:DNA-binding HxlR family transcriptional regulator